jgi:mono/diheme cytochrome c family protein
MGHRKLGVTMLSALLAVLSLHAPAQGTPRIPLHRTRQHASDLELGGELAGVPPGQTRFVAWADLVKRVSGIPLESLPALLGASPTARMLIAICSDAYNAHYPAAYLAAHHPLLVLRLDGRDPAHWPLGAEHLPMGLYMITHARFAPSHRVLAHSEQPQVPWGVVRLDFRTEASVYRPILPIGPAAQTPLVQQGFLIARENCFRCHDRGGEGGTKANRPWDVVARRAVTDPRWFADYVRDPRKINPASQMAPDPQYDDATLAALRAYFTPFAGVR